MFLADVLTLFVLTELVGINYLLSNLAGMCVGILVSYLLCVKWVFLDRRYNRVALEFPLFILTCLIGVSLNELLLWLVVEFGGIHYLVSMVIVTAVVFIFNFFFKKGYCSDMPDRTLSISLCSFR